MYADCEEVDVAAIAHTFQLMVDISGLDVNWLRGVEKLFTSEVRKSWAGRK